MNKKSPIILAVLCAVGVHTVLFTDAGHRLQGAITESSAEVDVSDVRLVRNGNIISLEINKEITKASKITASLTYNNESISLGKPESSLGIVTTQDEEYSEDIALSFTSPQNFTKGTVIATWKIEKSLPEIHTINLSDVQIETSEGTMSLSTKGTGEF